MKIIIASDIHGASEKFKKVIDFMKSEEIDKMILLGDIFNNYYELNVSSKEISDLLWQIPSKLIVVKGNCDTSFDQKLLPVNFLDNYEMIIGRYRAYFYHGHIRPRYNSSINLYVSGHTHVATLFKEDGCIYLNPGSVGRPRDFSIGSFAVMSEKTITIYDLDYKVLFEMAI